jgi:hypothetical protein
MASEILGLFTTPEQYQLAQQQAQQAQAIKYANLDPMARANYGVYRAGQQLANTIGGALGGEDPQLKMISMRQQLASQLDQNDPASFMKVAQLAAQSGDPQFAMAIADAGRQMQTGMATARKTTAEAQKAELTIKQEKDFRDELSKLVNPTEEDILRVATKYGSSDKVLSVIQAAITKAADRETRLDIEREKIEARAEEKLKDIEYKQDRDLQNAKDEKERAQIRAETQLQIAQLMTESREGIAKLASSLRQPPAPSLTTIVNPENPSETMTVDARIYKGGGKNAVGVIGLGKPSATQEKAALLKTQMSKDLDFAIAELTDVTKDGGLIDQSTGSGAGRLVDIGAGFVGKATKGSIAIGKLQPIADMSLKMVPRFEGPQSNADTKSYKEAAGQLADPTLPTEIRKEAGKTVLRLMKQRKNQFVTPELAAEGIGTSPAPSSRQLSGEDKKALDWANSNPNDPRAAQIKARLGVN